MFRLHSRALAGALVLAAAVPAGAVAAPGDVSTLAGGAGTGPATEIGLVPTGVAAAEGRVIVSDGQNGTIRAVSLATGAATTVAGIGAAGFGADGQLAVRTALPGTGNSYVGPQQVAVAPDGDVLVAVGGGSTVRRIDAATGIMSTVAGNGTFSSSGAGDGKPATTVSLGAPYGVAVAGDGAVLIADTSAGRVRRVDPATGVIGTLASGLSSPYHLALAPDGGVLVTEFGGNRLRRVAPDGAVTTIAGTGTAASSGDGGPATAAALNRPWGVAVLQDGTIVVSENAGRRIRSIAPSGVIGTLDAGTLDAPAGLAVAGDRLFVADSGARRVREVALPAGPVSTIAGNGTASFSGEDAPAAGAQLSSPWGVTVAPDGRIVIADTTNFRIRAIDPASGRIRTLAGSGTSCPSVTDATCVGGVPAAAAKFVRPWDVAVADDGTVYQLESNAAISRLSRLDPATGIVTTVGGAAPGYAGDGGPVAAARFGEAQGVAVAPGGRWVYVADTGNARVRRIDVAAGTIETIAGTGAPGFSGDGGAATAAQLASPTDVAVTPTGDVLIADFGNRRVRRIDASGRIETVVAAGVRGVAAGPRGVIALADASGHAVYALAPGGPLTRVAGTGASGFDGEDGGRLAGPASVAFESDGDLIVADTANNRIRRIENPFAVDRSATVGGTVPATLALTLPAAAGFGAFTPGVAREYTATTTAAVTSTGGDAALAVSDPGHLTNGSFALLQPLRVELGKDRWNAPVSNDPVTIAFKQAIGATDPLRTGSYTTTLVFTLSTTAP